MAPRVGVIALAAAAFLAGAADAHACTPQAFISVEQRDGRALDTVRAGEVVVLRGYLFDAESPVPVTLRRNNEHGPIIGRVPVDENGTWYYAFVAPDVGATESFYLHADVIDRDGNRILPVGTKQHFFVEPRPAGAPAPTPTPSPPAVPGPGSPPPATVPVVVPEPVNVEQPTSLQSLLYQPLPLYRTPGFATVAAAAPVAATPAREAESGRPAAPSVRATRALPVTVVPAQVPPAVIRQPTPVPSVRAAVVTPGVESAPLQQVAEPGRGMPLAVAVAEDDEPSRWVPMLLAAIGLLFLGGAVGGLVIARRWPPVRPEDMIEAELQQLIGEQRAGTREHIREP